MTFRSSSHGIHAGILGILIASYGPIPSTSAFAGNGIHRTVPAGQQNAHPSGSRSVIHRETHSKRDEGDRSRTRNPPAKPVPALKTREQPSRDGIPEFSMEIPR